MSLEGSSNIKVNALKEMNTDGISHEKIVKEKQNNMYTHIHVCSSKVCVWTSLNK